MSPKNTSPETKAAPKAAPKTAPKTAMEKGAAAPSAPAVRLTSLAAERLKAMAVEQEIPAGERNLRMSLKVGGCSGFSYEMAFDSRRPTDVVSEIEGVTVVVDPKDLPNLAGVVIDFVDTVQEQGFKITNPNAKSTCGCGQSFQA
jgi:iron-sulfur cluster assembly accessory protein